MRHLTSVLFLYGVYIYQKKKEKKKMKKKGMIKEKKNDRKPFSNVA